ncbi:hypothetical protein [Planktothricoides sp. SR001]|nr:hypothetical protein [Planktothricoides sp. SR001]
MHRKEKREESIFTIHLSPLSCDRNPVSWGDRRYGKAPLLEF